MNVIWFHPNGRHNNQSLSHCFRKLSNQPNTDVNWLPRIYDLTPLEHFLLEVVKDKCYANYPEITEALKHKIGAAIHMVEARTIEKML